MDLIEPWFDKEFWSLIRRENRLWRLGKSRDRLIPTIRGEKVITLFLYLKESRVFV